MRRLGVNGAAMVLLLALIVAACGGSSASDAAPPAPTTTTATPDAPDAPAATSPATTAAPSTTSTSAAPATTQSPTTTAAPTDEEIEAAIIDAYLQGWDDYYAVLEDTSLDPEFARETHGEIAFGVLVADQQELKADDRVVRWPSPSLRSHTVEVLRYDGDFATLRDCIVNDAYGLRPNGEIVNDELATSIWATEMHFEDGSWKTLSTEVIRRELGEWDCE